MSWYSADAAPTSTESLVTGLMETPTIRLVARKLLRLTRAERIAVRISMGNLPMLNTILERSSRSISFSY